MKEPKELIHFKTEGTAHHLWTDLPWEALCGVAGINSAMHVKGALYLIDFDPRYDQERVLARILALAEQHAEERKEP